MNEFADSAQRYRCADAIGGYAVNVTLSNGTVVQKSYCPFESGYAFLDSYGFDPGRRWVDMWVLAAFYVGFILVVLVCLRYVRHIKR